MPRREEQRVDDGVDAPGVDGDAAHGVADRMRAVRAAATCRCTRANRSCDKA